jgi:hypothetical protein
MVLPAAGVPALLFIGVTNTASSRLPAAKGEPGKGARDPSELMRYPETLFLPKFATGQDDCERR